VLWTQQFNSSCNIQLLCGFLYGQNVLFWNLTRNYIIVIIAIKSSQVITHINVVLIFSVLENFSTLHLWDDGDSLLDTKPTWYIWSPNKTSLHSRRECFKSDILIIKPNEAYVCHLMDLIYNVFSSKCKNNLKKWY
jgi:hypothetical protein